MLTILTETKRDEVTFLSNRKLFSLFEKSKKKGISTYVYH